MFVVHKCAKTPCLPHLPKNSKPSKSLVKSKISHFGLGTQVDGRAAQVNGDGSEGRASVEAVRVVFVPQILKVKCG